MLRLYNTLTRQKEEFKPIDPQRVTLYACGPTVYNYIHVGNARMIAVFDTLYRVLRHVYGEKHVTYARNITDVDDKIIDAAKKENVAIDVITKKYTEALLEDLKGINTLEPNFQPRATEFIPQMIKMIEKLIENGHAYAAEGHVLFDVPSFPEYGALSRRDRDEQIAGARVEVAPYKRDPADFVLWKPSTLDVPGWDSPWGRGRPGWHIECSAMATEILGKTFDIHGGGLDLTFPHHENEIAQSCCAYKDHSFAKLWMHNGFINVDNEKMSKSLGNFRFLRELLKKYPGEAIRYVLLSAKYTEPLEFSEKLIQDAVKKIDRWYAVLQFAPDQEATQPTKQFMDAICDDLNTPLAYVEMDRIANSLFHLVTLNTAELVGQFKACAQVLGLLNKKMDDHFQLSLVNDIKSARENARLNKDYKESDRLRDELTRRGVIPKDNPDGTTTYTVSVSAAVSNTSLSEPFITVIKND